MTTWKTVNILQCDETAPKSVQDTRSALQQRAEMLAKSRLELDDKLSKLAQVAIDCLVPLRVLNDPPYAGLAHRVDRVIKQRDVLVAQRA